MAASLPLSRCFVSKTQEEVLEEEKIFEKYKDLISNLPVEQSWPYTPMYQYKGFWVPYPGLLQGQLVASEQFKSRPGDILLVTIPKAGTTWLKSLVFAAVNRADHPYPQDSLLHANPHECVPFLESQFFKDKIPDLDALKSPRIFATHAPYPVLPQSVLDSDCRIVYLCRNPRDTVVSFWHFMNSLVTGKYEPVALETILEPFCRGVSPCGPFWDHALGYWKESLERPRKVLFLRYEELIQEPQLQLKRLVEFLGCPFSTQEVEEGAMDKILKLCSLESLTSLEINKTGHVGVLQHIDVENTAFFRKGQVGDWVNYLTPEMAERLDGVVEEKLHGSGLTFMQSAGAP